MKNVETCFSHERSGNFLQMFQCVNMVKTGQEINDGTHGCGEP
jgi:hypothetical protein